MLKLNSVIVKYFGDSKMLTITEKMDEWYMKQFDQKYVDIPFIIIKIEKMM